MSITLNELRDYFKNISGAVAALGSAALGKGMQIAGTDGTNARAIKTTADGTMLTQPTGSYVRLSTETLPTAEADGVKDGNDLLVIDVVDKNNNKVYVYRTGAWREI